MTKVSLIALSLLALALSFAACGGDDAPTLAEYMATMDRIDKDTDTRFETVFGEETDTAREAAAGFKDAAGYAQDQIDGVTPADEAKDAHEELVAAIGEFVDGLDPDSFAEDASIDEFFADLDTTRVDEAFCEVQKIADDNNIDADVGCDAGGESVDPATIPAEETTDVSIQDFAFDPPHIQVSAGDTVTWEQGSDGAPHDVTSSDDPTAFESETLEDEGATFEFTFDEAGEFPYHCSIHPEMLGLVTVVE